MQRQFRAAFARLEGEVTAGKWISVDSGRKQDTVADDIWAHVAPLLDGVDERLWLDRITE